MPEALLTGSEKKEDRYTDIYLNKFTVQIQDMEEETTYGRRWFGNLANEKRPRIDTKSD